MPIDNGYSKKRSQCGSSMIEVLVALFITAIGLMGVQGMQLDSLKANVSSSLGTEAQLLVSDMGDRILAYDSITSTADDNDYNGIDTSNSAADPNCDASGCNKAAQLSRDVYYWKTEIENTLPGGQGTVTAASGVITIAITWDGNADGYSIQLNLL